MSGVYLLLPTSCTHRGQDKILRIREIIVRFDFLPATEVFGVVVLCRPTITDLSQDCCTFLRPCATSRTVPWSIPGGVTGIFSDIFLPTAPWPWGRLNPWWKWVPGTIPGGKGGRCV